MKLDDLHTDSPMFFSNDLARFKQYPKARIRENDSAKKGSTSLPLEEDN